jgi:hypothetical protein
MGYRSAQSGQVAGGKAGLACKLHQSITGWHAGPVKNAADLDILVINWGHSL